MQWFNRHRRATPGARRKPVIMSKRKNDTAPEDKLDALLVRANRLGALSRGLAAMTSNLLHDVDDGSEWALDEAMLVAEAAAAVEAQQASQQASQQARSGPLVWQLILAELTDLAALRDDDDSDDGDDDPKDDDAEDDKRPARRGGRRNRDVN